MFRYLASILTVLLALTVSAVAQQPPVTKIPTQTVLGNGSGVPAPAKALSLPSCLVASANGLAPTNSINNQSGATYTINSLATSDACRSVYMTNASATTVTLPTASAAGSGFSTYLNCDAGCTVNSTSNVYVAGLGSVTSFTLAAHQGVELDSDGTVWRASSSAVLYDVPWGLSWTGGVPGTQVISYVQQAVTIDAIVGVVGTASGVSSTLTVYEAPSGTACASGTALHSGSLNLNGTTNTEQTLTVTTSSVPAGDYLCFATTGSSSTGNGSIAIYAHPS
jgi:hypothetical protein